MKKIFLLITLFFVSMVGLGQNRATYYFSKNKSERKFYQPQDAIKYDVLKVLAGDLTLAYERQVGEKSSIEFEIGPTISRFALNRMNYLGRVAQIPDYNPNDASSRQSDFGILASVAYRIYLLNNYPAMNGLYVAPKLKFKNYNDMGNFGDHVGVSTDDFRNTLNQFFVVFDFGMVHWFSPHFGLEYYTTFGLTMNFFRYHTYQSSYDEATDVWTNTYSVKNRRFFNPTLALGLKLNFGL